MGEAKLKDVLEGVVENTASKDADGCHVGDDGLLVCDECGKPRQKRLEVLWKDDPIVVPVACDCILREESERQRLAEYEEACARHERARADCFMDAEYLRDCTFDRADGRGEGVVRACENYAAGFDEAGRYGLVLHGSVGGGKTYLASAIANRVIDDGYTARVTDIGSIVTLMESSFRDRQDNLDRILSCDLLVLDDLGTERGTEYMMQHVHAVIDGRYRRGKPMVVTTNIDWDKATSSERGGTMWERVVSRLSEVCYPLEVAGNHRAGGMVSMKRKMRGILKL